MTKIYKRVIERAKDYCFRLREEDLRSIRSILIDLNC